MNGATIDITEGFEKFNKSSKKTYKDVLGKKRLLKFVKPVVDDFIVNSEANISQSNYKLRNRKNINYNQLSDHSDDENSDIKSIISDEYLHSNINKNKNKQNKVPNKNINKNTKYRRYKKSKDQIKRNKISTNNINPNNKNKKYKNTIILTKIKMQNYLHLDGDAKENSEAYCIYEDLDSHNESYDEDENAETFSDLNSMNEINSDDDIIELRKKDEFPDLKNDILDTIKESESLIKNLQKHFFKHEEKISLNQSEYPNNSIPIMADIRRFNFDLFAEKQKELTNGKLFDVIMMDPPWQLSSSQPTRGVAIAYDTLNDNIITELPIQKLQNDGFIFIWTINAKFKTCLDLMKKWGYTYCDEIVWIKQTVNGKIAKGHGYYLQHTKESCLVGKKGNPIHNKNVMCDVIFSKRRGQSQKPEEIYTLIEGLVPNGFYLELFGRRNNLRENWLTLGNEL